MYEEQEKKKITFMKCLTNQFVKHVIYKREADLYQVYAYFLIHINPYILKQLIIFTEDVS